MNKLLFIPPDPENYVEIFTPYITKNGKRIYPTNGRYFHFWIPRSKYKGR